MSEPVVLSDELRGHGWRVIVGTLVDGITSNGCLVTHTLDCGHSRQHRQIGSTRPLYGDGQPCMCWTCHDEHEVSA